MLTPSLPDKTKRSGPTLTDVIARIDGDTTLQPTRRRDLVAGVKALCRIVGRPPGDICADARTISDLLSPYSAGQAGLSQQSFRNMRSRVRSALKQAGLQVHAGRQHHIAYTPAWAALVNRIEDRRIRDGLTRFVRVCVEQGWEPEDVDEGRFAQFDHILQTQAIMARQRSVSLMSRQQWNRAVGAVSGWPQHPVALLPVREAYTLSWSDLPPSLVVEVDALFQRRLQPDLLDDQGLRQIRPATAKQQRFQLLQVVSALAKQGVDPQNFTSLATILTAANINLALKFFMDRAGGKISSQVSAIAVMLRVTARGANGDHATVITKLKSFINNNKRRRGLSDKNRARLRPLDDPKYVDALLGLPRTLLAASGGEKNVLREASLVRVAVAVELLLHCPIRVGNLVSLTHRHFVRSRPGPDGLVHLVIPAMEVKNDVDLEFELPPSCSKLIDCYVSNFRQIHCDQPSDWLFPTKGGGHVDYKVIGDGLHRYAKRYAGLELNPHLFRHITAKLYLDNNPGGYEVVRRILGHKSMDTTTSSYTGIETLAAAKHFDRTILRLRERSDERDTVGGPPPRTRSRRSR